MLKLKSCVLGPGKESAVQNQAIKWKKQLILVINEAFVRIILLHDKTHSDGTEAPFYSEHIALLAVLYILWHGEFLIEKCCALIQHEHCVNGLCHRVLQDKPVVVKHFSLQTISIGKGVFQHSTFHVDNLQKNQAYSVYRKSRANVNI